MSLEIKCSDLGHGECNWKAVSNTEDKLADLVAVHMRDQHGVSEFTQEMIAEVKNLATEASLQIWDEDPMLMEYHCSNCNWRYIAQTVNLIADAVALHARDQHGVTEFTEEMITEVKNSLNPWSGK
jgi:predicted small metal-binding protein